MSVGALWNHQTRFHLLTSISSHDVLSSIGKGLIPKNIEKGKPLANLILAIDTALGAVFLARTRSNATGVVLSARIFLQAQK